MSKLPVETDGDYLRIVRVGKDRPSGIRLDHLRKLCDEKHEDMQEVRDTALEQLSRWYDIVPDNVKEDISAAVLMFYAIHKLSVVEPRAGITYHPVDLGVFGYGMEALFAMDGEMRSEIEKVSNRVGCSVEAACPGWYDEDYRVAMFYSVYFYAKMRKGL